MPSQQVIHFTRQQQVMGIKKNVFGSQPEKENYYKLYRQWVDKYPIYHNLPILNIFDVKPNHPNFTFLKNTSIDYTLCDRNDRPLLCIEFDGMQEGFSSGKNYHPMKPKDLERQRRLEVKLSIAENEFFPFFIVGYKEFEGLSIHSKLGIQRSD